MGLKARLKKLGLYRPIVRWIITHVGALLVMAISLLTLSNLSTAIIFTDKIDETGVVALRYSFQALPFESKDTISNFSGENLLLLNVTHQGKTQVLYSENFTSQEVKDVGILERDEHTIVVLFPFEVEEEKEYVIDGDFSSFFKYGTKQEAPVLVVEKCRGINVLDEFRSMHRNLFYHVGIGLWVLTASSILAIVGSFIWLSIELGKYMDERGI